MTTLHRLTLSWRRPSHIHREPPPFRPCDRPPMYESTSHPALKPFAVGALIGVLLGAWSLFHADRRPAGPELAGPQVLDVDTTGVRRPQ